MKKLNNKGFTLIELLAVLVILIAIMSIAIPSISSSLDRTKGKQDSAKGKIIESAAELYVTDHKNNIIITSGNCYIDVQTLVDEHYLSDEELKDSDGKEMGGAVMYGADDNSYEYFSQEKTSDNCIDE